jgi:parallel beta-helix repeat protein
MQGAFQILSLCSSTPKRRDLSHTRYLRRPCRAPEVRSGRHAVKFAAAPSVTISGGANGFMISGKSYITVRGFKVTGTTSYGISVSGSKNITIRDNTVTYSRQP